jgi:hypothetical protein
MEEMELVEISVGEKFPLFKNSDMRGQTGMVFEAIDAGGYAMLIYMDGMSKEEVDVLNDHRIDVRIFKDSPALVLPLIKFIDSPIQFEIIFDPTLYKDQRAMQLAFDNNLINLYAIDSDTNIVKAIRSFNMPKKLREIWVTAWTLAFEEEAFSPRFTKWVNDVTSRYSLTELWGRGESIGYMGEYY